MKTIRTLTTGALIALGLAATVSTARAEGWGFGPGPGRAPGTGSPFGSAPQYPQFRTSLIGPRQPLPVFQASPWYQYWPYDAHFLTPAPVGGAFYGPAAPGNFPVNPYFPAGPSYPYGQMPGGPAPYGYPPAPAGSPIPGR